MAIIDGNYSFLDLRGIKDNIIDVFAEYFGEEYRDTISARIGRVLFVPYHSTTYINDYYLEHIAKYDNEIYDRTLAKLGLKSTPELRDALYAYGSIKDNNLKDIVFYNGSIANCIAKRVDETAQAPVARAFGINTGDPYKDREALVRIYKTYLATVREVEKDHPCDVFRDIDIIERNTIDYTRKMLKTASEMGFPISDKDKSIILRNDLELCDLLDLDSYGSLFVDSVSYPGSISYFSSAKQKELEESDSSSTLYIIKHRLQYLFQNGATPVYFTREEIFRDDFLYSMDKSEEDKILKEYYFQLVASKDIIPSASTVDAFEAYREDLSKSFAHNTTINHHMQRLGLTIGKNTHEFFASNRYPGGKEKNQVVAVAINFDPIYDDESFLNIIMHELDHAISFFNHLAIGNDKVIKTRGAAVSKLKVINGEVKEEVFDNELDNLEEFCNQQQTEELARMYISKYGIPSFPKSDTSYRKDSSKFVSLYDSFAFLAGDFYEMFKPELKKAKVDNTPLYYDYTPNKKQKPVGGVVSLVKERIGRIISPRTMGKIDYSAAVELARVITDYRQFAQDTNFKVSIPQNFEREQLDSLNKYQRSRILEFAGRKDKIMRKISLDHKMVKKNRDKVEPRMVADVFFNEEDTLIK